MTATNKNPTVKPVLNQADAALCFSCALNSRALDRTFDRTFDAISPCPKRT
jgi:hypothetical protein